MLPTSTNVLLPQASRLRLAALLLLGLAAAAPAVHAQTSQVTILASFTNANGAQPYGNLTFSGNTLYGTTSQGGASSYGTVFSLPITGGTPTVLADFNYSNGANPVSDLIFSGGTLYGTTPYGGAGNNSAGTVFSVPAAGGALTTLTSFDNAKGEGSAGGLTLSGSTLYGTGGRGAYGYGQIFTLPTAGGKPTIIASFDGNKGKNPHGTLTLSGNTLYGVTSGGGGADDAGTVFSLPASGGTPTVLASFSSATGQYPVGNLTLSGDRLYGTTYQGGGTNGFGTVFSVPVAGGAPTVLATFSGTDGSYLNAGLVLNGSTLYGTTLGGAGTLGTVFSVPTTGGTPTVLAQFDGLDGKYPHGGLTFVGDTLYGTTSLGGAHGFGTVFSLKPSGNAPVPEASSLISFGLLLLGGVGSLVLRARRRTAV